MQQGSPTWREPGTHVILLFCDPQVPAYWVAQLQMEMLASGTHSIVLLSRSATKVHLNVCLAQCSSTSAEV
jgi:hypothetical protein